MSSREEYPRQAARCVFPLQSYAQHSHAKHRSCVAVARLFLPLAIAGRHVHRNSTRRHKPARCACWCERLCPCSGAGASAPRYVTPLHVCLCVCSLGYVTHISFSSAGTGPHHVKWHEVLGGFLRQIARRETSAKEGRGRTVALGASQNCV